MKTDYKGRPIPDGETDDTKIMVWVIAPALSDLFDEVWIRSYQDAVKYAQEVIYMKADGMEDDEMAEGVSVKMRVRETTVGEYAEVCANEG